MWRMPPGQNRYLEKVKVSQLKSFQPDELTGNFSPRYFVSPSSTMYPRGFGCWMWWEVGVRWLADNGGRWGERSKFFVNKSKRHPKNKACHQHLTLFFRPLPAVGIYGRPRGSDRVEVGHGSSGRRCHDGGEGEHEVSPCLVLIKSLVSISKILQFRWNLRILSTTMSPTCFTKRIYDASFCGREIRRCWRRRTWSRCENDFVLGDVGWDWEKRVLKGCCLVKWMVLDVFSLCEQ
jgi:hypothetical protein